MSKIIGTGSDSRTKLLSGVEQLANAVVTTLGPNGRNVVIAQQGGNLPQSTKDGVTVAKSFLTSDPQEHLGQLLLRQAAMKTADKAGDGTTTSTLLAREMIKNGLTALDNGENAVQIKRDIDKTVKEVLSNLKNNIAEDISGEEQLEQIATISSNNDVETGKLIAQAIEKVGLEGVVHVEESKTGDTYLETVEGLQFDRGFKSPYFVTGYSATQTGPCVIGENQQVAFLPSGPLVAFDPYARPKVRLRLGGSFQQIQFHAKQKSDDCAGPDPRCVQHQTRSAMRECEAHDRWPRSGTIQSLKRGSKPPQSTAIPQGRENINQRLPTRLNKAARRHA